MSIMLPDELLAGTPPWMGLARVASLLGVHRRTLNYWAANGAIPAYKIGGQWRVDREELRKWLQDRHN